MQRKTRAALVVAALVVGCAAVVLIAVRRRESGEPPQPTALRPSPLFPSALDPSRTGSIEGRLLARSNGQAVAGAVVRVRPEPDAPQDSADQQGSTTTDANGHFEFKGLGRGAFLLTAESDALATSLASATSLAAGERLSDVVLWADAAHSIAGTLVVQGDSNRPMPGLEVIAMRETEDVGVGRRAIAAADGRFQVSGLSAGRYRFHVAGQSLLSWAPPGLVELGASDVSDLRLAIPRGTTIRGHVQPRGPSTLWLRSAAQLGTGSLPVGIKTEVGTNGEFELRGVPPGEISLVAESKSGLGGALRVTSGFDEVQQVVVALDQSASITGRVVDASGSPPASVQVLITSLGAQTTGNEQAFVPRYLDADGRGFFRALGLHAGRYELGLQTASGELELVPSAARHGPHVEVELARGESLGNVELIAAACFGSISGTVTDSRGEPASGAWLGSWRERPALERLNRFAVPAESATAVGIDGHFQLSGLCPGSYEIGVSAANGAERARQHGVRVGSTLELKLHGLTSFKTRVSYEGAAVTSYTLSLSGPSRRRIQIEGQSQVIEQLEPGAYELLVWSEQGYGFDILSLPLARPEFSVRLIPWASVRGNLVTPTGQPLANANVTLILDASRSRSLRESTETARLRRAVARTDASGQFEFVHLAAGSGKLWFDLPKGRLLSVKNVIQTATRTVVGTGRFMPIEIEPRKAIELGTVLVRSD